MAFRFVLIACLASAFFVVACSRSSPDEWLATAKALHAKGDLNAAIVHLKSALQEDAEHGETRLYLAVLYSEAGDYRSAEKEFRRALDLKVEPARVLPGLAKSLVMQGEAKKALAEINAEGITEPGSLAGILAVRGLAYLTLRQIDDARKSFDEALRIKPDSSEAMLGRARLLASEHNLDAGLAEVNRAIEASPKDRDAMMLRGDFLRALGREHESRQAYELVVAEHPGYVPALLSLVSLDVTGGRLDDASKRLAGAQKVLAGNPMASYFQALIAFRKKDFTAARDAVHLVLKSAPNHLPSLLLGGVVEFALGSQELAQARLRYVLERAPTNLYARRVLVASYARSGQTQKAMEALEPGLKQAPQDPTLLALAGEIHMQANDYNKAQTYFQQASALDPKNAGMLTGLGLSRLAAGDVDAATADLEAASRLDSNRGQSDVLLVASLLQRAKFEEALKAAQGLVKKQPDNAMSYNLVAAAYIGKNDLQNARRALEKALDVQPAFTPAAANLAQLDLQVGDKQAARKRFQDIIARDKTNVQAYIGLASIGPRIDASKDEIQGWLEAARRASPGTIQPLVLLARFHLQSNEPKKALELMEKALTAAPENSEVLDLGGQVQLAVGEKNRALATFSKWVASQPSALAYFRLGTAQLANDDMSGAANAFRRALAYRAQFPEAQVLLAETEMKQGRMAEALYIATDLQRQLPTSPVGWVLEGNIRMHEKKFAAAATAYDKGYERSPSGTLAIKVHAALAQDRRPAEGEARLRQWLARDTNDVQVRRYLAEAYLKRERYKEAIAEYERLAADNPEQVVVLNNLAWAYQKVNDKRAVATAEQAVKLRPNDPNVMDTLGWILVERGDVTQGARILGEAARLAPKSAEIRYHYAQAIVKKGNESAGKEELEKLLFDFPDLPWRVEVLARLKEIRG